MCFAAENHLASDRDIAFFSFLWQGLLHAIVLWSAAVRRTASKALVEMLQGPRQSEPSATRL